MTISDAQPGDIYVDANGNTWKIVRVEPEIATYAIGNICWSLRAVPSDPCWHGWQRVFRRAA